jgi:hypothetical protein
LKEFEQTESGQLPKATFESINLDESANPPSFSQHTKRKQDTGANHPVLSHDTKGAMDQDDLDDPDEEEELIAEAKEFIEQDKMFGSTEMDGEERLSDLDDDPEVLNSIAMSDDETEFKRELWMAENQDWVARKGFFYCLELIFVCSC